MAIVRLCRKRLLLCRAWLAVSCNIWILYADVPAPRIALDYWKLAPDARLRDVIVAVRADEARHREVNHGLTDLLACPDLRPQTYPRGSSLFMHPDDAAIHMKAVYSLCGDLCQICRSAG